MLFDMVHCVDLLTCLSLQMDGCKGDISDSVCDTISGKLHAMLTGENCFIILHCVKHCSFFSPSMKSMKRMCSLSV